MQVRKECYLVTVMLLLPKLKENSTKAGTGNDDACLVNKHRCNKTVLGHQYRSNV